MIEYRDDLDGISEQQLEVVPDYQGRGIGTELVRRMLGRLQGLYGIDVCCDEDVAGFYDRFEMVRVVGMGKRNF